MTAANKPLTRNNAYEKLLIKGSTFAAFSGRTLGVSTKYIIFLCSFIHVTLDTR